MTAEKELWALALWVEKHHGTAGALHIAEKIGALALAGEQGGVELWRQVARRFDQLCNHDVGAGVGAAPPN